MPIAIGRPAQARAQDYGDPSGKALVATADLRVTAVDGERSWINGGLGKARFGGDGAGSDDGRFRARAVEGDIVWQPQFSWSVGATIAAIAQHGQEHAVDLSEAYVSWRRDPHGTFRLAARAGLFWPPVSLEHSGPEWAVTETITPSAINSWIGEEVKVGGAEATGSLLLGAAGRLSMTAGVFGFNDTAGTLLAYRGWALNDEKATAFGHQPLPPLDPFSLFVQAPATKPVAEIDHRAGYYLRLGWSPGAHVKLHAFYYDNRGDPEAVDDYLQWGWRTRFTEMGGTAALGTRTRVTVQAMGGRTTEGYPNPQALWADTRFHAAFALLTRDTAFGSVSGRIEAFGTRAHGSVLGLATSEDGWAATLAAKHPIGEHIKIFAEILHVGSDRADRARLGAAPRQDQTIAQLAFRLHS